MEYFFYSSNDTFSTPWRSLWLGFTKIATAANSANISISDENLTISLDSHLLKLKKKDEENTNIYIKYIAKY